MVKNRQARWTIGELDPKMTARNDLEFFYSALDLARDVVILPEGGFCRRPGTVHIVVQYHKVTRILPAAMTITAPEGGVTANANDNNTATELLTVTNIGVIDPYVVVQYDLGAGVDVAYVDVVGGRVTGGVGSATEFFIQYSNNAIAWTTLGAAIAMTTADTTIRRRCGQVARYFRFVKIGGTDLGANQVAIDEFHLWQKLPALSEARFIPYKFNIDQRYMLIFTDQNISVYKDRVYQADIRCTAFTSDHMALLNRTSGGDTVLLFHEDVPTQKLTRNGADHLWTVEPATFEEIPLYDFTPVTTSPAATLTPSAVSGKITLTASAAVFAAGNVDQIIEGNGGRARVVGFTSTTVLTAITEIPFYTVTAIAANSWTLQSGWEDAWSTARGWPRSGAFHQQRLWIGGSKSRPRTAWASVLGDYFNFDQGAHRDTDSINVDMDNEEPIVNMLAHRTLQIFSTGGESAIIQQRGTAITPNNPGILSQTEQGSEPGLKPVVSNGVTLFVQRNGQSISQIVFSDVEQAFTAKSVSLYSSHLIRTPVDFALRRSTSDHETNWVMVVNSDGTIACGSILTDENIKGFTLWTHGDGTYKNIGVDESDVWVSVERTVNAVTERYIEIFDFDYYTDSATQVVPGVPITTLGGLFQLEGKTVKVKADGRILADAVVAAATITTARAVTTLLEVGLGWTPQVKLLPYENPEAVGDRIGSKKRINEAILRLYETSEVFVNGVPVSLNSFDGLLLDQPLPIFTGEKKIEALRGWDTYGQIEITQENPLPLTVLCVGMEASV